MNLLVLKSNYVLYCILFLGYLWGQTISLFILLLVLATYAPSATPFSTVQSDDN